MTLLPDQIKSNDSEIKNNTEHSDQELVLLTLNDADFYGELIERYEKKITRYVRRISNITNEDCQDVIQDVFIKAYTNLNGFDKSLSFSSWIYRIAHNMVIDFHRKNETKKKHGMDDVDDEIIHLVKNELAEGLDIQQDLLHKNTKNHITQTFDAMKYEYREVLILKFIERKSYDEISDILKKPSGTVATLIHRAKKQFQNKYQENKPYFE